MDDRLGIDIGTHSIGWAAFRLGADGPEALLDAGVRVFGNSREPKSDDPLGKARREARQARRQRDRRLARQQAWLRSLIELGLLPADDAARRALSARDPCALRARALREALPPDLLGRALLHLAKRRGFNGIEVRCRAAGWRGSDGLAVPLNLVSGEMVHDHDIALAKGLNLDLLDPSAASRLAEPCPNDLRSGERGGPESWHR